MAKGIEKASHFIRICEKPGIALVDSKPVVQAKEKMDRGSFSTNRRLQNLLANLSAHRMRVQYISAKLLSPLLSLIDFSSRQPVPCDILTCRICQEATEVDTAFLGQFSASLVSDTA